ISYSLCTVLLSVLSFFFQAEDGIRDPLVTGVQTCALPISLTSGGTSPASGIVPPEVRARKRLPRRAWSRSFTRSQRIRGAAPLRSEERRVGREWSSGGGTIDLGNARDAYKEYEYWSSPESA